VSLEPLSATAWIAATGESRDNLKGPVVAVGHIGHIELYQNSPRTIFKTRSIGLTELVVKTRVSPLPERWLYFSNPSRMDHVRDSFAQCGHNEAKMDWLVNQLRDENLFYPDPELARAKAESHRRYYTVSTAFTPEQVDRHIDHLFYQFSAPRPRNLNASRLSLAVSLAIKSM
jgi:hypothetical protein